VGESWVDEADQVEVPLAGGDVTEGVVRVGDTVGFEGAPRFLGTDGSGREVLSYIDGEIAGRPRPPWIADETRPEAATTSWVMAKVSDTRPGSNQVRSRPAPTC
jgi:hypothetical protein